MGEMAGGVRRSMASINMEITCGSLLSELELIWTEIGETEMEKDKMLFELERECMQVYKRKVDKASTARARLHQTVTAKEAELAALRAALGEHTLQSQADKRTTSLKEQLASVTPLLEEFRAKKEERAKQFAETRSEIAKITREISGFNHLNNPAPSTDDMEEIDLSLRKLNEQQARLRSLQKEKSDRLHKVLEYVNEVHHLCGVLVIDFRKTVDEVHPSLHEAKLGQSTNISNGTLDGLAQAVLRLRNEKKSRMRELQESVASLYELWNLMDSPEEERGRFGRVMVIIGSSEDNISDCGVLSLETLEQTAAEVDRLTKLKASRMKELVSKRRMELEDICKSMHIEPDMSTSLDKAYALIDSGIVDPSEILSNIENQILKAKEESIARKDIMDRIAKWLATCEEESWLEEYNQDSNRYSTGRGNHLNLKRAERARITVTKIPGMVDNLMSRTFAWEDERNTPFMYNGVRLVLSLEEYKLARQQKEEEKKRYREQKKLRDMLLADKESPFGSKPSPKRCNGFNRKLNAYRVNGSMNGSVTPAPRRASVGSATPEVLTPRSYSGHQNGYIREMRKLSTAPLNFVSLPREETVPLHLYRAPRIPNHPTDCCT